MISIFNNLQLVVTIWYALATGMSSVEQHYMDVMSAQQNGFVTFAETKVNISSTSWSLNLVFISCRSLKFFIYISKSHMHSFFLFTSLFIHKWFFTFERSKVTKIFCKAEGISLYLSLTATSMSPHPYSCFR